MVDTHADGSSEAGRGQGEPAQNNSIASRIAELEGQIASPSFWSDKAKAQSVIKEIAELKEKALGAGKYDKGPAIMTIFSGAGGDDAEDFSRMLFNMYGKFAEKNGWSLLMVHANENDHGGYRNITFEVEGKHAYGTLKHESGVHRLVRQSPFNAKKLRQTSFSLVEVLPRIADTDDIAMPAEDLKIEFSKSGGPGGQNVNKRNTAVRVTHMPTGVTVHVVSERSQNANREKAIEILKGKLYRMREAEREKEESGLSISKTTEAEWGSQIRSYVLHPYKLVKDHRTDYEEHDAEHVLEDGAIEGFIEAMRNRL